MAQLEQTTADAPAGGLAPYMRVSSDGQKQQGTIENQRTALDRYLAAQSVTPYGWYQDDGVSGTVAFASRPDGARLLADIKAGHVQIVLITKLDRFGRNAREILNAAHELERAGARLISLKENVDTRTIAGRFFLTVLSGVAELERDMILEKTNEGTALRLLETTWMGGHSPIGYRVEGKRKSARLVERDTPDEGSGYSEADAVRLAWHLLVEQDWPCERIAEHLASLGIPTRTGRGEWAPNVIYQMFTNPVYKGEREYRTKDGRVIIQSVPALVSVEAWERAQATLERHRRSPVRAGARDYLLRGLMRCAHCGQLYTTSWTRRTSGAHAGQLWRYYACSTRHFRMQHSRTRPGSPYPKDCIGAALDAERIEAMIWADVEEFARDPGKTLLQLAAAAGEESATAETHRAALAELQQQLDAQQAERDTIYAKYRKGRMSERDLDRQLDLIAEEEAELSAKRDALATALTDATTQLERLQGARILLQQLHARLDDPEQPVTPAVQREMVEAIVKFIRVDTVEIGLSVRGRMKRKAEVTVRYTFKRPGSAGEEPGEGAYVQSIFPSSSAWR